MDYNDPRHIAIMKSQVSSPMRGINRYENNRSRANHTQLLSQERLPSINNDTAMLLMRRKGRNNMMSPQPFRSTQTSMMNKT